MKALSMLKRLAALKKREFIEPAGPVTLSDDWQELKDFILGFLEHRFPDAYLAMIAEFDQIETEDRERGKPDGLQLKRSKREIPWMETERGRSRLINSKIADTLNPWPESKWALAAALCGTFGSDNSRMDVPEN